MQQTTRKATPPLHDQCREPPPQVLGICDPTPPPSGNPTHSKCSTNKPPSKRTQVLGSLRPEALGVQVVKGAGALLSARHGAERLTNAWHGGAQSLDQVGFWKCVFLDLFLLLFWFFGEAQQRVARRRAGTGPGDWDFYSQLLSGDFPVYCFASISYHTQTHGTALLAGINVTDCERFSPT